MNKYEIMFIVSPVIEEAAVKQLVKDLEKALTDNQAKMIKNTDWGLRELAYEIKKQKKGHYFIFNIESDNSAAINEFDRLALLNENILRHMIIKEEE